MKQSHIHVNYKCSNKYEMHAHKHMCAKSLCVCARLICARRVCVFVRVSYVREEFVCLCASHMCAESLCVFVRVSYVRGEFVCLCASHMCAESLCVCARLICARRVWVWKAVGAKNTWILTRQQRVFNAYFTRISRVKYVLLTREKNQRVKYAWNTCC